MSAREIDAYLADLDEAKRATLEQLRQDILHLVPDAEQGLSYSVPAFRVGGKLVAGFSAAGTDRTRATRWRGTSKAVTR